MTQALSKHFEERVQEIVDDWKGHDSEFFDDMKLKTIAWHIAKAKSLVEASEFRRGNKKQFIEAVGSAYGREPRRIYEDLAVFNHYSKRGEGVMEISQRIYADVGGYSKALKQLAPPRAEEEAVEASVCSGSCPKHCQH
jgi:hypothetical protein